jgi:glutamate/tyrosine decarboxylase-like PLP-dependent enzyme
MTGPARDPLDDGDVASWFLGPKAENQDLLERMALAAIWSHGRFRRAYRPEDPTVIDDAIRRSPKYRAGVARLEGAAEALFARLRGSAPFASMRYHGHMLWDQALPATVGYFAAMLYNQNNVAAEASPVTTRLEVEAAAQLCALMGYGAGSWGHLTCDGTVANIEALWALREARYRPAAVAAGLASDDRLAPARALEVVTAAGDAAPLRDLDPWAMVNLPLAQTLGLEEAIAELCGLEPAAVAAAVRPHTLAARGWLDFHAEALRGLAPPRVLAPASAHYSWPKAATVLGLGADGCRLIPLDGAARMDADALAEALAQAAAERSPTLAVVAAIGSTELGAVDPLGAILDLRRRVRAQGQDFAVHCDAAWGGYFATLLRPATPGVPGPVPQWSMKPEARAAFDRLAEADTITVDPHKAGYVPYPAGALLHRDGRLRALVSVSAAVVRHAEGEPSVGVYGLEGSKPGAAAAAVHLAHEVIGLNDAGYGKLLGQCLWTSKRVCLRLNTMDMRREGARFRIRVAQPTPAEAAGGDAAAERARMARMATLGTDALLARLADAPDDAALFAGLGSDLLILGFVVNFRTRDGDWNTSLDAMNRLTDAIFARCSLTDATKKDPASVELMLTASAMEARNVGRRFLDDFAARAGVEPPGDRAVRFLITTAMNPWATDDANAAEPRGYDHFEAIETALARAIDAAMEEIEA